MKKIYISAYCNCNVGDDMFVQTLVRRYPYVKFILFADRKLCAAFRNEPNLHIVHSYVYFIFKVLKRLRLTNLHKVHYFFSRHSDVSVKIGGSIFIEPSNWNKMISSPKFDFGKNAYYVGANFGPYTSDTFIEDVKRRLQQAKDCCFRDTYSRDVFKEIPHIRYAPDVLFGYKDYPRKKEGDGIGISVISFNGRRNLEKNSAHYYSTISAMCDMCCERNIPVTLFSFCEIEGDSIAIAEIMSRVVHKQNVEVCTYSGNIKSFISKLNERKYWVTTRFHAMILGWAMGKVVLPVIYSEKQTNVISDVGYMGAVWDILSGMTCSGDKLFFDCINNKTFDVEGLMSEADKQFEKLDRIILNDRGCL